MKIDTHNPVALGLMISGAVLMLGTLIGTLIFKPPDAKKAVAGTVQSINKNKLDAKTANKLYETKLASARMRLWDMSDDKIAPEALKRLNALAKKHGLTLTTFRANQKEVSAGALNILPLFVTLDGPFPGVGEFVRDFEENESLLVLSMLQIASTDQTSHKVTASVAINAYIDPNRSVDLAAKTQTPASPSVKSAPKQSRTDAAHRVRGSTPASGKA